MTRIVSLVAMMSAALALAGCEGGIGGDPGAQALPAGQSCQSLRAELNRMDSQGAQSKVERVQAGKGDAAAKAMADRYNQVLNQYLGARCHV